MTTKRKKSRKPASPAQLRARVKFAKIMKSGGFGKRIKSAKKRVVRKKRTTAGRPKRSHVRPSTTRRSRGGSASDLNKSLLLDDIARTGISKISQRKIVNAITKRLRV